MLSVLYVVRTLRRRSCYDHHLTCLISHNHTMSASEFRGRVLRTFEKPASNEAQAVKLPLRPGHASSRLALTSVFLVNTGPSRAEIALQPSVTDMYRIMASGPVTV